jgi:ActR/RegA family two-component response regulator
MNMKFRENVLIVEDEDQWRGIYERAVSAQKPHATVRVAEDLASAERLIEETKFAVAFVDVGLDISDDRNVDGLQVMKKLKAAGDGTSIIVVTGRSGQDVLSITRNAIKEYGAYDTVAKHSVRPSDIRQLLEGGLKAYRDVTVSERSDARDALLGKANPMYRDDQVMRMTKIKGSALEFYEFLSALAGKFLPVVPRKPIEYAELDLANGFVYGEYWSRAIASAIIVCFGAEDRFDEACAALRGDTEAIKKDGVADPIEEIMRRGVKGRVFVLAGRRRDEFGRE